MLLAHFVQTIVLQDVRSTCQSSESILVLKGEQIPALVGHSFTKLSAFSWRPQTPTAKQAQKIFWQWDPKDLQGRYLLPSSDANSQAMRNFVAQQDELVFLARDLGQRITQEQLQQFQQPLLELEFKQPSQRPSSWLYFLLEADKDGFLDTRSLESHNTPLHYSKPKDEVSSAFYKIGFAQNHPFLLNAFHWRESNNSWGDDLTDMMKIRHQGRFLGLPFKRTQADYQSRLSGVKQGPLRIIRRTENTIKIFWKLSTPSLSIDYVMMPDGFIMDTLIDLPFRIDLFFSELQTLTTMDWEPSTNPLPILLHYGHSEEPVRLNGRASLLKPAVDPIETQHFSLTHSGGHFKVWLDIPKTFPIQTYLYLKDDIQALDPPENSPGQFANIGFKTTGWENLESQTQHLKFTVCLEPQSVLKTP